VTFIKTPVFIVIFICLFLLEPMSASAVDPDEMLANPVKEARARAISLGLRCVVCRNQTIDDSNAPLARDLRILLRERINGGDSDEAAVKYLVDRYGPYILLKPPLQAETLLLWISPVLLLIAAFAGFSHLWRRNNHATVPAPPKLSVEERALVQSLLKNEVSR